MTFNPGMPSKNAVVVLLLLLLLLPLLLLLLLRLLRRLRLLILPLLVLLLLLLLLLLLGFRTSPSPFYDGVVPYAGLHETNNTVTELVHPDSCPRKGPCTGEFSTGW